MLIVFVINGCESSDMKKFIPDNISLRNDNYALVVNTNGNYGLIDNQDLLISNRDSIGYKLDFLKFIPGEGRPTYSLSLYKGSERIKFESAVDNDKIFLGGIRKFLIPLEKKRIQGTKEEIIKYTNSIEEKSIYYLSKPNFKKFSHSFKIRIPTIIIKAKYPLDEQGLEPYVSGNYPIDIQRKSVEQKIRDNINALFPKGAYHIDFLGGGAKRGTYLITAEKLPAKDSTNKVLTDHSHFYYFDFYTEISCNPQYYYDQFTGENVEALLKNIKQATEQEQQELINKKMKILDKDYQTPLFLEVDATEFQISVLRENEYLLEYLEKTLPNRVYK